jgi:hypothetical protein
VITNRQICVLAIIIQNHSMKILVLFCSSCVSLISLGQQNTEAKLFEVDSICLTKAMAMIDQIKAEGTNAKYYRDNEFLINLSLSKDGDNKNRIRILNLGNDKSLSFTILEIKVAAIDSAGNVSIVIIDKPVELVKELKLIHCNSFSIEFAKIGLPGTVNSEIRYIRIKLSYSGKEVIAKLGADE